MKDRDLEYEQKFGVARRSMCDMCLGNDITHERNEATLFFICESCGHRWNRPRLVIKS